MRFIFYKAQTVQKYFLAVWTIVSFLLPATLFAQQPGGAGSPKYWYQTEKKQWKNMQTGRLYLAGRDTLNINFHTALGFPLTPAALIGDLNLSNWQTFIGVYYPEYKAGTTRPVQEQFLAIEYHNTDFVRMNYKTISRKNDPKEKPYGGIDGWNYELDPVSKTREKSLKFTTFENPTTGCQDPAWGCDNDILKIPFKGYIPEFIIFDRGLDTFSRERERIESYLSIKYGITLELNARQYLASDQSVLLEKNDMGTFIHRICAIGRDDQSGLWQQKSNTSYEENNLSYDFHSNGNTNLENNRSLTLGFFNADKNKVPDRNFIFWGDDKGAIRLKSVGVDNGNGNRGEIELEERKWMLYNRQKLTNNTSVLVSGTLRTSLQAYGYNYFLLKDDGHYDKEDFYPLAEGKEYWQHDMLQWKEKEQFTFGRVDKLKPKHLLLCDNSKENCSSNEYYFKTGFLGKCNRDKIIGYKYRNAQSIIRQTGNPYLWCDVPSYLKPLAKGQIEVYFSGGLPPYSYKVEDKTGKVMIDWQKNSLNVNANDLYIVSTSLAGQYNIIISDFTNQQISIPVLIK